MTTSEPLSLWRRIARAIADFLSGGADDNERPPPSSNDESAKRRLRLKLTLVEKRGRGGYR